MAAQGEGWKWVGDFLGVLFSIMFKLLLGKPIWPKLGNHAVSSDDFMMYYMMYL
jgi:hypothetical protein